MSISTITHERTLVLAAIWNPDHDMLLARRQESGYPQWDILGGKLQNDETPIQTFHRELLEEGGIVDIIHGDEPIYETSFTKNITKYNVIVIEGKINSGKPTIEEPQTYKEFAFNSIYRAAGKLYTGRLATVSGLVVRKWLDGDIGPSL